MPDEMLPEMPCKRETPPQVQPRRKKGGGVSAADKGRRQARQGGAACGEPGGDDAAAEMSRKGRCKSRPEAEVEAKTPLAAAAEVVPVPGSGSEPGEEAVVGFGRKGRRAPGSKRREPRAALAADAGSRWARPPAYETLFMVQAPEADAEPAEAPRSSSKGGEGRQLISLPRAACGMD